MEFIFMFTRDDQTVEDCLEVFDLARETGVKHLGFKDVGVARETLVALNDRIRPGRCSEAPTGPGPPLRQTSSTTASDAARLSC